MYFFFNFRHTVASGPSSILQAVQGFQLVCGGDHGTTLAALGLESMNASRT